MTRGLGAGAKPEIGRDAANEDRDRISEIEYLCQHFVTLSAKALQRPAPALSDEALDLLRGYHWPGNLRELRNVLERATLLCSGPVIVPEDLPAEKLGQQTKSREALTAQFKDVPDAERAQIAGGNCAKLYGLN